VAQPFDSTTAPATFPWEGAAAPASSQSAIDWILVQEKLRMMGYRDGQIRTLYEQDVKSRKDKSPLTHGGDLLSPLFSGIQPSYRGIQRVDIPIIVEDQKLLERLWGRGG
jgi:hypothetical protein